MTPLGIKPQNEREQRLFDLGYRVLTEETMYMACDLNDVVSRPRLRVESAWDECEQWAKERAEMDKAKAYLQRLKDRDLTDHDTIFIDGKDEQGRSFGSQEDSSLLSGDVSGVGDEH